MAGFGKDQKNPGSKDQQFTKQVNVQRPRGSVPSSKGSIGKDTQFNKGTSYDDDDGSTGTAGPNPKGPKISGVGSSNVQDQQFTSGVKSSGTGGKLGGKSSGGTPGSFDSSAPSAAQQIMRAIATASQKPDQHESEPQGSTKVSSAKSKSQTSSYKNTTPDNAQARPKSQVQQKVKKA